MSSTMRLGAIQPRARLIDYRIQDPAAVLNCVDDNLAVLAQLVDRAGRAGCDAAALPEDTLGLGKWIAANDTLLADVLPLAVERMLERLGRSAAAHSMYLVCCNDLVRDDGAMHNTSFFLGRDGGEIGRYFKVNMPYSELGTRCRGTHYPVFPTPDLGGVGLLICYDMIFPEAARCLALGGADIIFHSTLGGAAMGDGDISRAAFRTRAVENFVYLVVSWRGSGSMIIAPNGDVLVEGAGADDIAIADIDPRGGRQGGNAFDYQEDMRARLFRERAPETYGMLVESTPPALDQIPADSTPEEITRICNGVLTMGEDGFKEAEELLRQGETAAATVAFKKLRKEYPGSWIDRVSSERLNALRA